MEKQSKVSIFYLIGGIASFVLGFYFFGNKIESLLSIAIYLGISVFARGLSFVFLFFANKEMPHRSMVMIQGIIDLIFGSILLASPIYTLFSLPYMLGFWLIFTGFVDIFKSFQIKKAYSTKEFSLVLIAGLCNLIVGIFVFNNPLSGLLAINFMVSFALIVYGIKTIIFYFKK